MTDIIDAIDLAIRDATDLHLAGQSQEGEIVLQRALLLHPDSSALRNACGVMQASQGKYHDAVASYRRALAVDSPPPAIWTNLGNALTRLGLSESAIGCHDIALEATPGDGGLHYNRGISLAEAGRHGEAALAFTTALRLAPDHAMARWDRARSYLHLNNLAAAWPDYEVRLENGLVPLRAAPGRRWNGGPYAGRRLLLLAEQGFGDMIWACRYLPMVKALGGELIVESPPELVELFHTLGVADRIVLQGDPLPDADAHAWQCSLPGFFTPSPERIPAAPFIKPDPARMAALRPVIDQAGDRLRVGIVWSGSTTFVRNAERAQSLRRFIDAFDQPGVQLFSLQKGPPEAEIARDAQGSGLIDLAPHLRHFADTAAAVALLDLVIMTDTAVAHLTGAMGRPVWVLLGRNAHWLWLQERGDNPWYPAMRLFRPRGDGDWSHVFDSAAVALMQRARRK